MARMGGLRGDSDDLNLPNDPNCAPKIAARFEQVSVSGPNVYVFRNRDTDSNFLRLLICVTAHLQHTLSGLPVLYPHHLVRIDLRLDLDCLV